MDDYKKSIRIRIWLLAIPVAIAAVIGIYDVFLANQEVKETFIFGFQSGIATSLGLLAFSSLHVTDGSSWMKPD